MVEVRVCIGTSCHLNGSYNVVQGIQQLVEEYGLHDEIDFEAYFCMKECQNKGVSITVEGEKFRVNPEDVNTFFHEQIKSRMLINQ